MHKQSSNNVPGMIFQQEILILFYNNNSNFIYEIIDQDDVAILSPNFQVKLPESQIFEMKKDGTTHPSIIDYYVKEIQRISKTEIVENRKPFLANIICDPKKAEVKFVEIDEKLYKLWKKDGKIVSCFNEKSINLIKNVLEHLCSTRQILYESETILKDVLEKYVDEKAKENLLKRVCFVMEKDDKLSKRIDQRLISEILRLELEELINKLKNLGEKFNSLLIDNQKLIDSNGSLKEKIVQDDKLDFDELTKQKERNKLKQILKDLKKKLSSLKQNLKDKETENSKLLTDLTLKRHLDCEIIKNRRIYNKLSLEMVHAGKLNRLGEARLAEAIDLGAELQEDISKISNHLTKLGFKIQKFTMQNTSKDSYFADCIETGRDFINQVFVKLEILLMDTIPNLETNLGKIDRKLKGITRDIIELKKEKSELKKEILFEKIELERTIQISVHSSTDDELSNKSKNHAMKNKLMKFYKTNYELSDKLLQAETCCNDLACKLEVTDYEKENLKLTIKKQEEMLRENQITIDKLKGENVTLKSKNDDLLGTLITSMVLLYCSKKIVSNWIKDNETKQSKI